MTAEDLKQQQELITQRIYNHGIEKLHYDWNEIGAIADGVSDIESYLQSSPKVMWVLKEAYDNNDGGYSMPDDIKTKTNEDLADLIKKNRIATYRNMIYVMEGLRNPGSYREDMDDYTKMCYHLRDIAYININKMPALNGTKSDQDMSDLFESWKEITLEQIDLYSSDIIIFGNTLTYFTKQNLLGNLEFLGHSKDGATRVFKRKNQIIVDAYHPSSFVPNQIDCIIDIINSILIR